MTLEEVRAKLVDLWYVDANYVRANGVDVVITRSSEWTFESISEVADALDIRNIDLRSIAEESYGPDGARIVRRWCRARRRRVWPAPPTSVAPTDRALARELGGEEHIPLAIEIYRFEQKQAAERDSAAARVRFDVDEPYDAGWRWREFA